MAVAIGNFAPGLRTLPTLPETTEVVDPQNQIRMDLQHDRRQVRNGTQRHQPFTNGLGNFGRDLRDLQNYLSNLHSSFFEWTAIFWFWFWENTPKVCQIFLKCPVYLNPDEHHALFDTHRTVTKQWYTNAAWTKDSSKAVTGIVVGSCWIRGSWLLSKIHQEFQVPKMEVLNLIRLFWGWVFPFISLTYSLYRWVPPF